MSEGGDDVFLIFHLLGFNLTDKFITFLFVSFELASSVNLKTGFKLKKEEIR